MQTGIHASGGFIGDFDGTLQYASGNDMLLRARCWLPSNEHSVAVVTVHCCWLQKSIQTRQPTSHQVYILKQTRQDRKTD